MSIKCAHCGGRHAKLETVRQCAADAGVKPILPKRDIWLPTLGPSAPVRYSPGRPPAGYYWLPGNLVAKVRIPADGRWAGRYFVAACSLTENTEKAVFDKVDREEFLQWLAMQNITYFMHNYGKSTGYCPACGGPMSAAQRKIGYHFSDGPYGSACVETAQNRYFI